MRVRVIGGPWPERIGALGTVVEPPEGWGDTYPADPKDRRSVLVLLDDDPLGATSAVHKPGTMLEFRWTCRLGLGDVDALA